MIRRIDIDDAAADDWEELEGAPISFINAPGVAGPHSEFALIVDGKLRFVDSLPDIDGYTKITVAVEGKLP